MLTSILAVVCPHIRENNYYENTK